MGIGSPENPYVETNFISGRIVNVHWRHDTVPPKAATALWSVDPTINTGIAPELWLHDLRLVDYTGDPFTIITTGLDILIQIPTGFYWALGLATIYHAGTLNRPPPDHDLFIEVVQIDATGAVIETPIRQTGGAPGTPEESKVGGYNTGASMIMAVRGFMATDGAYDSLSAELTLSLSNTAAPIL